MLSVLIPIYNINVHPLVSELQAQLALCSTPYEIILADDASSDMPLRHHNSLLAELDHVRYIQHEENIGRSKIRNELADTAKYPVLLLMDCDARVKKKDYISTYLRYIDENQLADKEFVVLGGLSYRMLETNSEIPLRYKYGVKRELKSSWERNRNPYRAFTPFNMLIAKSVFQKCRFDESLRQYGYEDTFFGIALEKAEIPVYHIDNELFHDGIDTNTDYLKKVAAGVSNLVNLQSDDKIDDDFTQKSTLLTTYNRLKKGFLGRIGLSILSSGKETVRRITSSHNSLFFLDLYKLAVLHSLQKEANEKSKEKKSDE